MPEAEISRRIKSSMSIEEKNAREEIIEICEKCIKCGLCKELCPVFKVLREEQSSPRAHAILLSNGIIEEIIRECTLCRACEEKCPLNLKLCDAVRKARQILNLKGDEKPEIKKMIKNLEEGKNPYL